MKAICATQGLVLKDMTGFNIQKEYGLLLKMEKDNRQRLKLGLMSMD